MRTQIMKLQFGFTAIELLTTVAVIGISLGLKLPLF
jgi:prepilin-type N-terminal cleavage/methylation domain-containing protein